MQLGTSHSSSYVRTAEPRLTLVPEPRLTLAMRWFMNAKKLTGEAEMPME